MEISSKLSTERLFLQLDEFRRAAALGSDLHVKLRDKSLVLVATGQTESGRSVAWVETSGDVTSMFVAAIADAYGSRLSRLVADELGLRPAEGRPLSSRTVMQALSMAESISAVLEGVRFGESLMQRSEAAKKASQTDSDDAAPG